MKANLSLQPLTPIVLSMRMLVLKTFAVHVQSDDIHSKAWATLSYSFFFPCAPSNAHRGNSSRWVVSCPGSCFQRKWWFHGEGERWACWVPSPRCPGPPGPACSALSSLIQAWAPETHTARSFEQSSFLSPILTSTRPFQRTYVKR